MSIQSALEGLANVVDSPYPENIRYAAHRLLAEIKATPLIVVVKNLVPESLVLRDGKPVNRVSRLVVELCSGDLNPHVELEVYEDRASVPAHHRVVDYSIEHYCKTSGVHPRGESCACPCDPCTDWKKER
jgi:hypothetical protein